MFMQRRLSHTLCIIGVTLLVMRGTGATVGEPCGARMFEKLNGYQRLGEAFRNDVKITIGTEFTCYLLYEG